MLSKTTKNSSSNKKSGGWLHRKSGNTEWPNLPKIIHGKRYNIDMYARALLNKSDLPHINGCLDTDQDSFDGAAEYIGEEPIPPAPLGRNSSIELEEHYKRDFKVWEHRLKTYDERKEIVARERALLLTYLKEKTHTEIWKNIRSKYTAAVIDSKKTDPIIIWQYIWAEQAVDPTVTLAKQIQNVEMEKANFKMYKSETLEDFRTRFQTFINIYNTIRPARKMDDKDQAELFMTILSEKYDEVMIVHSQQAELEEPPLDSPQYLLRIWQQQAKPIYTVQEAVLKVQQHKYIGINPFKELTSATYDVSLQSESKNEHVHARIQVAQPKKSADSVHNKLLKQPNKTAIKTPSSKPSCHNCGTLEEQPHYTKDCPFKEEIAVLVKSLLEKQRKGYS